MSEASDALKDATRESENLRTSLEGVKNAAKSAYAEIARFRGTGAGGGGGASQVANFGAPGGGGGASGGGGGGGTGVMDVGGIPDFKDPSTRASRLKMLGGGALQLAGGISALLPTSQEAVNIDTLANRLRFYGNVAAQQNIGGAFAMQRALAALGTPTSAIDVAAAANQGAGQGLLPGLSNFNASADFGGILGGAALASNLTPGLGLQGGMAAMAGLNTARNVNMLRMIGVNVRNQQGQMNDLPDIIGQIYRMLQNAAGTGGVTPEAIAVSAMSGNALDSILNQYFGNDAALRQTVLSGLLQMANTGGQSLRASGTREAGVRTGALSAPVASLAQRNAAEQNMLQQFSSATNKGLMQANDLLSLLYRGAANAAGTSNLSQSIQGIQAGVIGMETISGARGGAGAMITDAILGTTADIFKTTQLGQQLMGLGPMGQVVAGAAAGLGVGTLGLLNGQSINPNVSPGAPDSYGRIPAATSGPTYPNANITINVTSPTGSDPWAFANQITQAMVNTARS